jgi:hypothetical protein
MTMRRMALPGSPKKDKAAAGLEEATSELAGGAETSAGAVGLASVSRLSLATGNVVEGGDTGSGAGADAINAGPAAGVATAEVRTGLGLGKVGTTALVSAADTEASVGGGGAWMLAGLAPATEPGRNLGG